MKDSIEIIEKPDWVSWDDIHEVVWKAHEDNRKKGILMKNPSLPGNEIERVIKNNGKMLVAVSGYNVIGTAGFVVTSKRFWNHNEEHAHLCFDALLPDYNGYGIYGALCNKRERMIAEMGLNKLCMDTHHDNRHIIHIYLKNGYKRIGVKDCGNHWNVVLCKWLDGCPYSALSCLFHYYWRRCILFVKRTIRAIRRK